MTIIAYWRCRECGRLATTQQKPPDDEHRRWVGTSLRHCGPFDPIPPTPVDIRRPK